MGRLALIDPWGWWRLGSGSGLSEEQRAGITNMELGHPGGLLRGGNSHLPTVAEKSHPVNGRWGRAMVQEEEIKQAGDTLTRTFPFCTTYHPPNTGKHTCYLRDVIQLPKSPC